jgi:hypothetical protein
MESACLLKVAVVVPYKYKILQMQFGKLYQRRNLLRWAVGVIIKGGDRLGLFGEF